jgi:glycosyltransferase involved in cell wall biosynthesis
MSKYPELEKLAHVVHNGVDAARYERADFAAASKDLRVTLGIQDDAIVFSCIAGFRPEKGHRILIEAFSRVADSACLLLVGDGPERAAIASLIRDKSLESRVWLLGVQADVRPAVTTSTATILASTAVETFSIAMLESMALAVPVIGARIGGMDEAIEHGKTGLLFPIGDVDLLAAHMDALIKDPGLSVRLGEAAESYVRSRFTLSQMVEKSEKLLLALA